MRRPLTLLFALALLPAAAGCDSGEPGGPNGGACADGSMTATANGQAFTAECVQIDISNGLLTIAGITNFDGSDGPTQRQINIGGAQAQVGTQAPITATYAEIDLNDPQAALTCSASPIPGAGSVTLTIDAIGDDSAKGSFSFTALCPNNGSSVTVTSGQFDIAK